MKQKKKKQASHHPQSPKKQPNNKEQTPPTVSHAWKQSLNAYLFIILQNIDIVEVSSVPATHHAHDRKQNLSFKTVSEQHSPSQTHFTR